MRKRQFRASRHRSISGFLLLALALRALIPTGFMPSAARPFAFELCPDGLPPQIATVAAAAHDVHAAHHHHGGSPDDSANAHSGHQHTASQANRCAFAVAATAPAPHVARLVVPAIASAPPVAAHTAVVLTSPDYRPQRTRGPPSLA